MKIRIFTLLAVLALAGCGVISQRACAPFTLMLANDLLKFEGVLIP